MNCSALRASLIHEILTSVSTNEAFDNPQPNPETICSCSPFQLTMGFVTIRPLIDSSVGGQRK
jgi:hypothetical protein